MIKLLKQRNVLFFLTGFFLLLAGLNCASAADLYALGAKVPILEAPKLGAAKIMEVKRGERLTANKEEKGWYFVSYAGKEGWVSRLLVSPRPPLATSAVFEDDNYDDVEGDARRRASSFTTAAAARGLSEDRRRISQKYQVDYSGLSWMERHEVEEEDAIRFVENKEAR